jgi:penicillin-binding protein 2
MFVRSSRIVSFLILLSMLASACSVATPPPSLPSATVTASPSSLPTPQVFTTSVPLPDATARAYLDNWKAEDYPGMYALLTPESQKTISLVDFTQHYKNIAIEAALSGVDYQILSSEKNPPDAQVKYHVILHSNLVGDVGDDTQMSLTLEQGQWRIHWDDTLVMSQLSGGNYLKMDRSDFPARALIYDRNGNPLMEPSNATAIGIYPDNINFDQVDKLYPRLSYFTGIPVDNIQRMVDNSPSGAGDYFPLGEFSADEINRRGGGVGNFDGVLVSDYSSPRFYFDNGIAPHAVGYVAAISAEDLEKYRRNGYLQGELVGQRGLEQWGEPYLLGKRGGTLYVRNAQDQAIDKLADVPSQPAQAITTTLDMNFQAGVQLAIQGFRGAVVVLERDTGRVLAIASAPSFDPNAFTPGNYNAFSQLSDISSDPNQPLFNRATEGQYPLGSVFKIITISAALQSGVYTPETTYQCGYHFTEVPGMLLNDWTWDHFQQDGTTQPSGLLTLPQGLIRSCNPFFWHIGLDLYNRGLTTAISDMARGFGLGSPTGITGMNEAPGNIPDPQSQVDAVNNAIGQGQTLVTPIQVADFVAAVGNGGTLYVPQIVERIGTPGQSPSFEFQPKVRGTLPISPANLQVVQQAMVGVIKSQKPRGTAEYTFRGMSIPIAGKTGTATSNTIVPHAWFAGYTFAENPDKPDIAIAVVCENQGEGADYAAPIFRRVIELYFYGAPRRLYPWEEKYNVWKQPTTEEATATPYPTP